MTEEPSLTQADQAYWAIRRDIVSGRLKPTERLRIPMLNARYDMGSSPLREALSRLYSDHLVVLEGLRGFSVAPISPAEARDISMMRCTLESQAIRRSIELGDDAWEASVVAAYHQLHKADQRRIENPGGDSDEWENRNREFHDALVSACGSPWLKRLRDMLYFQHERYRRLSLRNPSPARDLDAEHHAIMEACLARDADLAVQRSIEHIERTAKAVETILDAEEAERLRHGSRPRRSA